MIARTDAQLVTQAIDAADHRAFGELVARYQGRVFGLAYAISGDWADAQDLAQECFIRAYVRLPELREREKFAAWLRRIAFSVCMDRLRVARPELARSIGAAADVDELPDDSTDPLDRIEHLELQQAVAAAIRALPSRYRVALTMFHIDGQSYQGVAAFLDVPIGTVKSLVSRGREMLRPMLSGYSQEVMPMVEQTLSQKLPDDFNERLIALLEAVKSNDTENVARMLKLDRQLLNARGESNATALNLAAHHGLVDLVKLLLASGADATDAAHWAHHGKPSRHGALVELLRKHVWDHDERLMQFNSIYAKTEAQGEGWRTSELIVREIPATTYLILSSGKPIGVKEIQPHQDRFMKLVDALRREQPIESLSPNMFFYHQVSTEPPQWIFDNGFAVAPETKLPDGELMLKNTPAMRLASVLLTAGYPQIGKGWESLKRQIAARGLDIDWNDAREVYPYMESFDSPQNRTEIQVRIQS